MSTLASETASSLYSARWFQRQSTVNSNKTQQLEFESLIEILSKNKACWRLRIRDTHNKGGNYLFISMHYKLRKKILGVSEHKMFDGAWHKNNSILWALFLGII